MYICKIHTRRQKHMLLEAVQIGCRRSAQAFLAQITWYIRVFLSKTLIHRISCFFC